MHHVNLSGRLPRNNIQNIYTKADTGGLWLSRWSKDFLKDKDLNGTAEREVVHFVITILAMDYLGIHIQRIGVCSTDSRR